MSIKIIRYLSSFYRSIQTITLFSLLILSPIKVSGDTLPLKLTRQFPTESRGSIRHDASIIAAPLLLDLTGVKPQIIVPTRDGVILFLDAETGKKIAQVNLSKKSELISTPSLVENNLILLYQKLGKRGRESHHVAVIDVARHKFNPDFPELELNAEKPQADGKAMVKFNSSFAFSHSEVKHAKKKGSTLGYSYVAFGNAGDIQPFHGWLFEIDMDAWKEKGVNHAIKNVLVTTPEKQCDVSVKVGTREMVCAGGIWTPAGPQIDYSGDGYELLVSTGNGQLDLVRHDYANTMMRVEHGLVFDPRCDAALCKDFNPINPALACIQSCKNLFIPRLKLGDKPLKPATGECDKLSFSECVAWMDYDLGANAPVKMKLNNHQSVIVQASKAGAVYLVDADHLGTMFDRMQLIETCGTKKDPCKLSWRGMIITHPVVSKVDETPVVIIPTFVSDETHAAGIIALKIISQNSKPYFEKFWQFPNPDSPEATRRFRSASTLPIMTSLAKHGDVVWVVEPGKPGKTGTLYGLRIKDGKLIAKHSMLGRGVPLSRPIVLGNTMYIASKSLDNKVSWIESYLIEERNQ
ncbi:MAG: hypothetical protein KAH20_12705 [Methylococcales bacterium]|nr:hypothetical protein [Methylococcales bacterium]